MPSGGSPMPCYWRELVAAQAGSEESPGHDRFGRTWMREVRESRMGRKKDARFDLHLYQPTNLSNRRGRRGSHGQKARSNRYCAPALRRGVSARVPSPLACSAVEHRLSVASSQSPAFFRGPIGRLAFPAACGLSAPGGPGDFGGILLFCGNRRASRSVLLW